MLPVVLIAAIVAGLPFAPASFWERMASITNARLDQREFTGSREARQTVMREGLEAFATHPLTGVGAGQFRNYNPPGREERWRETHNALIQVAADLGIFGLLVFAFLIVRGALAARATHRLIARIRAKERERGASIMRARDTALLDEHAVAMTAGLAAWFVCALFASVAYNWTFYYLLALTVAARELAAYHLREATTEEIAVDRKAASLSAAAFSTEGRFHPA
jgi:O-antigen ligase